MCYAMCIKWNLGVRERRAKWREGPATTAVELCRGKTRARIVGRDVAALTEEIKDRQRREERERRKSATERGGKRARTENGNETRKNEPRRKRQSAAMKEEEEERRERERQKRRREEKLREGRVGAAIAGSCW